ncbi:hypothetical protein RvY_00550 [Ramazzottius varieornatus]|uniref:Uncharacterized protein n=1 Tax=Ramazzottius varieornatus TaxID=947166 RepID=A0A1D1UH75_RAMVA|nr:hypothetical protein RvY_00550 [Ramazzottius varieornatus]
MPAKRQKSLVAEKKRKQPSKEQQVPRGYKGVQDGRSNKAPLSRVNCERLKLLDANALSQENDALKEELDRLKHREDDRETVAHMLEKAELQLTRYQEKLKNKEIETEQMKRRLDLLEKAKGGTPGFDRCALLLDGTTFHDDWIKVELDMRHFVEENERLKAEVAQARASAANYQLHRQAFKKRGLRNNLNRSQQVESLERFVVGEWKVKASDYAIHWKYEVMAKSSGLSFRDLDAAGLIWPYGKLQTQWLMRSLIELPRDTTKKLKDVYAKWCRKLKADQKDARLVGMRNPLQPSARQLSSLDCALLARLLLAWPSKNQLLLLTKPHQDLPEGFRCDVRRT